MKGDRFERAVDRVASKPSLLDNLVLSREEAINLLEAEHRRTVREFKKMIDALMRDRVGREGRDIRWNVSVDSYCMACNDMLTQLTKGKRP